MILYIIETALDKTVINIFRLILKEKKITKNTYEKNFLLPLLYTLLQGRINEEQSPETDFFPSRWQPFCH